MLDLFPAYGSSAAPCTPQDSDSSIYYSFDSPGAPYTALPLSVYVKANPKETEKFVEKEYGIVDGYGEFVKGKKARSSLRRGGGVSREVDEVREDDGFELV